MPVIVPVRDLKDTNKISELCNREKRPVFVTKNGKLADNALYNIVIKRICKNNNITLISMHSLRHTFATRCVEAGMSPKTLQMILGHSNISITMNLYVHVNEETKVREMKNVERFFQK